jgi:uncharacterized protein (DUF2062 family)
MLDKARWYIRRSVFRTYRYLKHPRRLKASPAMRWFARHFLDKRVWRPCQATFAGGWAVGFFVSAQIIPGQLPLGIILAAIFRVNIPTVIVVSWLSNPVTFAPIAYAERVFGDWLLPYLGETVGRLLEAMTIQVIHFVEWLNTMLPSWGRIPMAEKGVRFAQSMFLGGILGGILAAPVGYALGWLSWTGVAKLLRLPLTKRLHLKRHLVPRPAPPPDSDEPPVK